MVRSKRKFVSVVRVVGHHVSQVGRRVCDSRSGGVCAGVAVNAELPALQRDHFLSAIAHEVEHVVDRLAEVQLALAYRRHMEFEPEELLDPVSLPITLHENGIPIERPSRPLRDQTARRIEPPDLTAEIGLTGGAIAVRARTRHDLATVIATSEIDGQPISELEAMSYYIIAATAGHDTTSYALLWTMTLLAGHPEATKLLTSELDSVLAGRLPTLEDLPRLVYTEQVIKEAMRLYPPAYVLGRRAASDTEIGGYPVRAGSEVIAWIFMTHRDPRWFPEPETFRPERFAPGAEANLPRLAYMPFGAGPRACIGRQFAMIEAQLMLARIYQKFTLELAPGHKVEPRFRITLMPKHGLRARLHARQP